MNTLSPEGTPHEKPYPEQNQKDRNEIRPCEAGGVNDPDTEENQDDAGEYKTPPNLCSGSFRSPCARGLQYARREKSQTEPDKCTRTRVTNQQSCTKTDKNPGGNK